MGKGYLQLKPLVVFEYTEANAGPWVLSGPTYFLVRCMNRNQMAISLPDHVSYRDCDYGSWFIRTLVNVFEAKYRKDHVMDMVTEVRIYGI